MRILYVLASYVLFAVLFPVLCCTGRRAHGFGSGSASTRRATLPEGAGPRIWLHGASAGDLLALSPMIGPLRERFPGCRIVLSHHHQHGLPDGAASGWRTQIDAVVYAPWDLWGATRRAVRAIRPDLLVLEYTEIWPNLIRAAQALRRPGGAHQRPLLARAPAQLPAALLAHRQSARGRRPLPDARGRRGRARARRWGRRSSGSGSRATRSSTRSRRRRRRRRTRRCGARSGIAAGDARCGSPAAPTRAKRSSCSAVYRAAARRRTRICGW